MAFARGSDGGSSDSARDGGSTLTIGAKGAGSIVVPDTVFLLTAGFERAGADLRLVGKDGQSVLVKDYFAGGGRPADLETTTGAVVTGETAKILAGSPAFVQLAQAGGGAAGPAAIGKITALTGDVQIVRAGVTLASTGPEKVQVDTPVYRNDVLVTGKGSSVAVTFVDKTNFALGEDARMTMNEFAYNPQSGRGQALLSVLQGSFSFVSGQVAKTGDDAMKVQLPTMTIGIRGTKVAGYAAAEGSESQVTLLQNDDGTIGAIFVYNRTSGYLITQANFTAYSTSQGLPFQQPALLVNLTKYQDTLNTLHKAIQQQGAGEKASLEKESPVDIAIARALAETQPGAGGEGQGGGGGFATQSFPDLGITVVVFQSGGELFAAIFSTNDPVKQTGGASGGNNATNPQIFQGQTPPPPPDQPAGSSSVTTTEDADAPGTVPAPPGSSPGSLTYTLVVPPILGTVALQADGTFVYTPGIVLQALAEGQVATDSFTVRIAGGPNGTVEQVINVNITGENDAPVAAADTAAASEDAAAAAGNVLANDADIDNGAQLQVIQVNSDPANVGQPIAGQYGTLVLNADGSYSYTPDNASPLVQALAQGEQVQDVFTYRATDEFGATSDATLTVTLTGVNDAPVANATTGAVVEDLTPVAQGNVLANASDIDHNSALTVVSVNGIALGSGGGSGGNGGGSLPLTQTVLYYLNSQGQSLVNGLGGAAGFGENILGRNDDDSTGAIDISAVFTGGLNFFGTTYTSLFVNNNGNVTFTGPLGSYTPSQIGAGYNFPIIAPFWADVDTRGAAVAATPGGNSTGTNLVHYDLDAANHVVTVTWDDVGYYSSRTDKLNAFQLQLIDRGNGDFDIVFRYESVNWTTGDASGGSQGLGGQPARAGYAAGDGQNYYELPGSGDQAQVLNWDAATGNTGQIGVYVFQVRGGTVVGGNGTVTIATDYGTLVVNADGSYTYTLNNASPLVQALAEGEVYNDTFTYTVSDQFGATSDTTLTIAVTGTNDAPVAHDDLNALGEDDLSATGNVLANDTDVDHGALLQVVTGGAAIQGTYGTLVLNTDGGYVYTLDPSSAALQALGAGQQAQEVFAYTVSDGLGGTATANLIVTVTGANDAPVAESGRTVVVSDDAGPVALGILAPTDVDIGDVLSIVVTGLPDNGTVRLANGDAVAAGQALSVAQLTGLTFTPFDGDGDTASNFAYAVHDNNGGTAVASVSIQTIDADRETLVGYYDMSDGQGDDFDQLPGILAAGLTAHNLTGLSAADLAGIDVLYVQNPSADGYGAEYLAQLQDIAAAVANGMTLIIHDAFAADAASILPGGETFSILRVDGIADIDVLAFGSLLANGPGGVLTSASLDDGSPSAVGYALAGSLPDGAQLLLSTGDPSQIVAFSYAYGAGHVYYSTIPLEYYLDGNGDPALNTVFQQIFSPNVVAYGASLGGVAEGHVFAGTAGNDLLVGGGGGDSLIGNGGHDLIFVGGGDDRIVVKDLGFLTVDGGAGNDVLAFDMDGTIDLSALGPGRTAGIERLDMTNGAANSLRIGLDQVLALNSEHQGANSTAENALKILGDAGDGVVLIGNWQAGGADSGGQGFQLYTLGDAKVAVEQQDLSVQVIN